MVDRPKKRQPSCWTSLSREWRTMNDTLDADLLTSRQVAQRLSVSIRTLWKMVKEGTFPQPLRLSRKFIRWKRTEVDEAIRRM